MGMNNVYVSPGRPGNNQGIIKQPFSQTIAPYRNHYFPDFHTSVSSGDGRRLPTIPEITPA
jgi:hypothetical protein